MDTHVAYLIHWRKQYPPPFLEFALHFWYTSISAIEYEDFVQSNELRWFMPFISPDKYEGWNFKSGNYLFTTDTK